MTIVRWEAGTVKPSCERRAATEQTGWLHAGHGIEESL